MQRRVAFGQVIELAQAFLLPGPGYGCGIIERQFPAGQYGNILLQEGPQFLREPFGGAVVRAQGHHRLGQLPAQGGNDVAPVDLACTGDGGGLTAAEGFQQQGEFRDGFQSG